MFTQVRGLDTPAYPSPSGGESAGSNPAGGTTQAFLFAEIAHRVVVHADLGAEPPDPT